MAQNARIRLKNLQYGFLLILKQKGLPTEKFVRKKIQIFKKKKIIFFSLIKL